MKFYNETKSLYLETDIYVIGCGAILLQTRDGTTCPEDIAPDNTILRSITFESKSLTGAEQRYNNIEREALGILHDLKKFHHYCSAKEVSIISNHKPLAAIFKKNVATLSQQIQCILLRIHQYQVRIIYKPGLELFIANCLSWHNYMENKDEETHGMDVRVDAIQISMNEPECMSIQLIQQAIVQDEHLQWLKGYIITGWPEIKDQVQCDIRDYWSFKGDMAVIGENQNEGQTCYYTRGLQNTGTRPIPHQSHRNRKNKTLGM